MKICLAQFREDPKHRREIRKQLQSRRLWILRTAENTRSLKNKEEKGRNRERKRNHARGTGMRRGVCWDLEAHGLIQLQARCNGIKQQAAINFKATGDKGLLVGGCARAWRTRGGLKFSAWIFNGIAGTMNDTKLDRVFPSLTFPVSLILSFTFFLSFFLSFLLYLSIHPSVHLSSISSLYSPSKSVATASYISTLPAPPASFLSRRLVLQHRRRSFFPAIHKRVLPARKHHRPRSSCLVLPLPPLSLFLEQLRLSFSGRFSAIPEIPAVARHFSEGTFPFQAGWKNGARLLCLVCLLNDDGVSPFFVPLHPVTEDSNLETTMSRLVSRYVKTETLFSKFDKRGSRIFWKKGRNLIRHD